MEYTKLHIPIKERLIFLFTGLIKSDYIISKTVKPIVFDGLKHDWVIPKDTISDGKIEDIPFFDLEKGNIKSNL